MNMAEICFVFRLNGDTSATVPSMPWTKTRLQGQATGAPYALPSSTMGAPVRSRGFGLKCRLVGVGLSVRGHVVLLIDLVL
jgi:hypothetical protein